MRSPDGTVTLQFPFWKLYFVGHVKFNDILSFVVGGFKVIYCGMFRNETIFWLLYILVHVSSVSRQYWLCDDFFIWTVNRNFILIVVQWWSIVLMVIWNLFWQIPKLCLANKGERSQNFLDNASPDRDILSFSPVFAARTAPWEPTMTV